MAGKTIGDKYDEQNEKNNNKINNKHEMFKLSGRKNESTEAYESMDQALSVVGDLVTRSVFNH